MSSRAKIRAVTTIDDDAAETPAPRSEILIRASWVGTVVFAVWAFLAVAFESVQVVALAVDIVLFFVGIVAFLVAYVRAIARSRDVVLGVGGIYFLAGAASRKVQVKLLSSVGIQLIVALITASMRPFTTLAFGMLVPMYGVGVAGLWGAFHGVFPERADQSASLDDDE